MPEFEAKTGFLPPGRYAASLDELHERFVESAGSNVRREIWDEWAIHRTLVECLAGAIARMWVGGSFVSEKTEPGDVDVTYLLPAQNHDRLDRDTLAGLDDLAERGWCVARGMRVDAYLIRLPEAMPVSQMLPRLLTPHASGSFRDIGLYDEFWQCIKPAAVNDTPGDKRRGYVEVLL
ncbi:hypothetical protein [Actinoplanes sp. NPDC051851]|uniref:DUF6932 family protein n=1 Tax=Actinoplanes sp. NPDC051851 TaxID=3154753 RepID=UPI00342EA119